MQGKDYMRVRQEAATGVELCENFKFNPLKPESNKLMMEFSSMITKAKAKQQKTNALSIKEKEEELKKQDKPKPEATAISKQ